MRAPRLVRKTKDGYPSAPKGAPKASKSDLVTGSLWQVKVAMAPRRNVAGSELTWSFEGKPGSIPSMSLLTYIGTDRFEVKVKEDGVTRVSYEEKHYFLYGSNVWYVSSTTLKNSLKPV